MLEELATGLGRVRSLFAGHAVPMLVPPWNRIASELVPFLRETELTSGAQRTLMALNTHLASVAWRQRSLDQYRLRLL